MELQTIPTANYLDILFDNRNKAYGGYELRKNYSKRTATACALVFGAILIATAYTVFINGDTLPTVNRIADREIIFTHIEPPQIIVPKQVKPIEPPATPKVNTVKITPPIIVPDNAVKPDDLLTDKSKLADAVPSNINSDGKTGGVSSITGDGTNRPIITTSPPPATPFAAVQEMPEFIGDISQYLGRQLSYPPAARENGIEGQVVVQFIVNEDGAISGAKIMRGIGGGCNEEALRVVNSMPKWKPGKQNGKTVKVYYTLPIRFQLD